MWWTDTLAFSADADASSASARTTVARPGRGSV